MMASRVSLSNSSLHRAAMAWRARRREPALIATFVVREVARYNPSSSNSSASPLRGRLHKD
jgi:hypothetical protein